jgi:cell division transport system permease protein
MALRLDYLVREAGQNIVRNWLLLAANVLIVTVSLTMLGVTLLLGYYGLNNAFIGWNDDVAFVVYMYDTATPDQISAVDADLKASKLVEKFEYYDDKKSYELFKRLFAADGAEYTSEIKEGDLPTSFRVKPTNPDASIVREMVQTYSTKAGVMKVDFPAEQVRQLQQAVYQLRTWLVAAVVALLVASVVLIFIAIQNAVFARRREIEVMRLVGATNWFIRIPFVIEGLIQGFVGGGLALLLTHFMGAAWRNGGATATNPLLEKFVWLPSEQTSTYLLLLLVGTVVGGLGSLLSVTLYLRV